MGLRVFAALALVFVAEGCAHHVRLQIPGTSPSTRFSCTQAGGCVALQNDNPADINQSGTAFVNLPTQCQGRFNDITVLDADSDDPQVIVTCATPDAPIGDM